MLLYPLEEKLNFPSIPIQISNGERRQGEVVAQKYQRLSGVGVLEGAAPQLFRIILASIKPFSGPRTPERLFACLFLSFLPM
jgi:hypothetical protein